MDLKKIKYSPVGVKFVSNNKIREEFDTTQKRDETLAKINSKNAGIEAEPSRVLNPMIIVKGISKESPPQTLVETIISQNEYSDDNAGSHSQPLIALKFKKPKFQPL